MKLFYYKAPGGNFGDDLNAWLWSSVEPQLLADPDDGYTLVGIGTLLGIKMPADSGIKLVIGTGTGLEQPQPLDDTWKVLGVRGPLTARVLGLPPTAVVGDGAFLLRSLAAYRTAPPTRSGVGFMPHVYAASLGDWGDACRQAGITYLDPRAECRETLDTMHSCSMVLADAMHGAIVSDTLRVPWVPLISSCEINTFKWLDWAMSVKAAYRPTELRYISVLHAVRDWYWPLTGWNHKADAALIESYDPQDPRSTDSIFERFLARRHASPLKRRLNRAAQGVWRRILLPTLKGLQRRGLFEPIDRRLRARVAAQLRELGTRQGILSETAVLDSAVERLKACVRSARELADGSAAASAHGRGPAGLDARDA
ncbi:polysaccharide pyruvyl transferase family protein [Aureimonas sp. AU22]|uniref:polysaccharide pyruvyl transferase family protein n=1 Tax=Aureimonas sp. AU22 TaxID=1638162 RepID=UPI000785932F|nr:polysaccharide pyruvyl transferase family protein [Aureimonas sp. AU22]